MDDELKGNSFKQKALESFDKNELVPAEKRAIGKVATGHVKQKKKSAAKVFKENFINEDAETIKSHIFLDIFIPTVKDLIYNGVSSFFDMILYGNTSTGVPDRRRYSGNRVVSSGGHIEYNKVRDNGNQRRSAGTKPQAGDDIFFEERGDAIRVLDELCEQIDSYGYCTAYDLYDAAGLDCEYTLKNWGWYDLGSASISRTAGGDYIINMPKMVVIK